MPNINDTNTHLRVYLCNLYSIPQSSTRADLTSLIQRNLASRTGDYNNRWNAMLAAARATTPTGQGRAAYQGLVPLVVRA